MAVGQIISRAIADGAITTSNINDGEITHAKLHTDMDLSAKTLTVPATVRGPATLTIDPAAVGDNTGLVVIAGSLQVDGTTTTINSTTLTVDDKNIVLASGAGNGSAADGAGITIDGASATMLYTHATTSFDFNKPVNITGTLGVSGTTTLNDDVTFTGASYNVVWDKSASYLRFLTDARASFGTSDDLRIWKSNNGHSFIYNETGNLVINNVANDANLRLVCDDGSGGSADYLMCDGSTGEIVLYHYGSQKFATKSAGIEVTGDITTKSSDGAILKLQTSDTDIVVGDVLGAIEFTAPDESDGGDAILPGANISAVALSDFSSTINRTALKFTVDGFGSPQEIFRLTYNTVNFMGNMPDIFFNSTRTDVTAGAILGRMFWKTPDETSGGDAIVPAAVIQARANSDFTSTSNETNLEFGVGHDTQAQFRLLMVLEHDGKLNVRSDTGGILKLQTLDTSVSNGDTLGAIEFSSPVESSDSDSRLTAAAIVAEANASFTSTNNSTDLVFKLGQSGTAQEKLRLHHEGYMRLNRVGNGDIIELLKDGTKAGSIGIEASGLYVDGEASHAGLKLFATAVGPRQNGADIDATIDLGWTGGKFKDIYASGTVYATPGGNDGSSANYAAKSANEILNNYGYKPSGLYWIREPNTGTPKQIYCDMETDGGGWMLWLEYNTSTNSMHNQATARANLGRSYNNNYSKYEVMVDASYVNQINRRSLRGVWELDSNGAIRSNGFRNWGEVRLPEQVGDQFQPDLDQYYNMGANGEYIARDEYFGINGASGWTSIGTGSQYVYIREPNPAVKPGAIRSYGGINYVWDYDGTQYGWWVHESSYAVPMFNTVTQNGGFEVGHASGRRDVMEPNNTTGQNSYVNVNNSNNGPSILGVGSGVLVGEFSIMFNLGYSWGWSEMYIQDAIRTDNNMKNGGSPGAVLGDSFQYANNSSNNQGYYVYKTNDGVTQATAGNLTPYSFGNYYTMSRRRDGNMYVRTPGGNIYNPGTFFGPMKFFSGAQSPHSTQILNVISAGRNSALTASNETAQTTLRH